MPAIAEFPATLPKLPPHALEPEQSPLGGMLLDNINWEQVVQEVSEADFYHQNHRLIYHAITALLQDGVPADVVTVGERLEKDGGIEQAGGAAYLGTFAHNPTSVANIPAYARIVHECAIFRALICAAGEIPDNDYSPPGKNPRQVLAHAGALVF